MKINNKSSIFDEEPAKKNINNISVNEYVKDCFGTEKNYEKDIIDYVLTK